MSGEEDGPRWGKGELCLLKMTHEQRYVILHLQIN